MQSISSIPHQVTLNDKVIYVPKSATLTINEKSKQLIADGREVIKLGLGQSPFPVPDIMVKALKDHSMTKDYMAVQGYLPLRKAIAGFLQHNEDLDRNADNIIIGPGSKELLFGMQMVLDCDLVLPAPSWVSYDPQARLLGKSIHWLPCRSENGWKLEAQVLDRHCKQHANRQQLLILNSPNNPSGACFTEQELIDLARVAAANNVIIISDEIYSELHYQGEHMSIARFYSQGTVISNGISKWAGAGGWRLGFLSFPQELKAVLDSMIVVASETFTSVSAPIQMASVCAFENSSDMLDYIRANRSIMAYIGREFTAQLNQQNIQTVAPDGGFYNLGDFSYYRDTLLTQGITSAEQMCQQMLDATGVAALPGKDFGLQQGLLVRFAFVDFDGNSLLSEVMRNPDITLHQDTPQLTHLFNASQKMGEWLNSL